MCNVVATQMETEYKPTALKRTWKQLPSDRKHNLEESQYQKIIFKLSARHRLLSNQRSNLIRLLD